MNKLRNLSKFIFFGVVFTLFATVVYADLGDAFIKGLTNISNFFDDSRYRNYALAIDFFIFTAGLTAMFFIGLVTAFGYRKDAPNWESTIKRPIQMLAIVLGLLAALLLIRAGYSTADLLPYMHWFLCALIFIFIYKVLERLGLKSVLINLVVSFVLAMIICTFLTGLVNKGPSDTFWDRFSGVDIPSPPTIPGPGGSIGGPSTGPSGPGTGPDRIIGGSQDDGSSIWDYWWIPLLLVLAGGGAFGLHRLSKWRRRRRANEPVEAAGATTNDSIEGIRENLEEIIKAKKKVHDRLTKIVNFKRKYIEKIKDLYHKALSVDPAYYQDPGHEVNKELSKQGKRVTVLIEKEFELEKDLEELNKLEQKLLANGINWTVKIVKKHWKDPEVHKQALELKKAHEKTPIGFYEKLLHILERSKDKFTQKDLPPQYVYYREKAISLIRMLLSEYYTIHPSNPSGKATEAGTHKDFLTDWRLKRIVNQGYCRSVIRLIGHYFLIGEDNKKREKQWEKVTKPEVLKDFVTNKDKWKRIESSTPEAIKAHFLEEERFFNDPQAGFKVTLERQIKAMNYLIGCLKILEKLRNPLEEQKTEMQPLMIRYTYKDSEGKEQVVELDAKEMERKPPIPLGARIEVHTLLKTGEGPNFKLQCLLNNNHLFNQPLLIEKTDKHPKISVMISDYIAIAEGEHTVTFDLRGDIETDEASLKKWNRDLKSIKIRVRRPERNTTINVRSPGTGGAPTGEEPTRSNRKREKIQLCNPSEKKEFSDEHIKQLYAIPLRDLVLEWLKYAGNQTTKKDNKFLREFYDLGDSMKRCYKGLMPQCISYDSPQVLDLLNNEKKRELSQWYERAMAFNKYLFTNYNKIAVRLLLQLQVAGITVAELEKAGIEEATILKSRNENKEGDIFRNEKVILKLKKGKINSKDIEKLVEKAFSQNKKKMEAEDSATYLLYKLLYRGAYYFMGARDFMMLVRKVAESYGGKYKDKEFKHGEAMQEFQEGMPKDLKMNPPTMPDESGFEETVRKSPLVLRSGERPSVVSQDNPTIRQKDAYVPVAVERKQEKLLKQFHKILTSKEEQKTLAFRNMTNGIYLDSEFKRINSRLSKIQSSYILIPYSKEGDSGFIFPVPGISTEFERKFMVEAGFREEVERMFDWEYTNKKSVKEVIGRPAYVRIEGDKVKDEDIIRKGLLRQRASIANEVEKGSSERMARRI